MFRFFLTAQNIRLSFFFLSFAMPSTPTPPAFPAFTTLRLLRAPAAGVSILELARPAKRNALTAASFDELPRAVAALAADADTRAVVLRGAGDAFCAGADLAALADTRALLAHACPGRGRAALLAHIGRWQAALSCLEDVLSVPVVAAVHGACVGGAIDLITAADVRFASADAVFRVAEADLAIAADLGTLQRLPRIVGQGVATDWALTARPVGAAEAARAGLVTRVLPDRAALWAAAEATATAIAAKSPLAVAGTKRVLLQARDSTVAGGLAYVAAHNAALLPSADLEEALTAAVERRAPVYRSRL